MSSTSPRTTQVNAPRVPRKPIRRQTRTGFSLVDLRRSALHLLQLAAQFEHRPTGVGEPKVQRQILRALGVIDAYVRANVAAERRSQVARLSELLADFYKLHRTDSTFDAAALKCAVTSMLNTHGYSADAATLKVLVASSDEIVVDRGPVLAAELRLGTVFGIDRNSISNWRLSKVALGTSVPFPAQVGPLTMVRHVVEMLLAESPVPDIDLEKVKSLVLELVEAKHVVVAPALARLSAMGGRAVTKLEL
jgi:hypothetical protein